MDTHKRKPTVRVCSYCQGINSPAMAQYAVGIDRSVKDEMKKVDAQIKSHKGQFVFSHGVCQPHLIQYLQQIPNMTKERLVSMVNKSNNHGNPIPCLLTNAPLRHAFMNGLFTTDEMQKSIDSEKKSNEDITGRFKKLAGI